MFLDCGKLQTPENGYLVALTTTFKSLVTFFCDVGFDMVGSSALECHSNGYWNGSEPSCLIRCKYNVSTTTAIHVYPNAIYIIIILICEHVFIYI